MFECSCNHCINLHSWIHALSDDRELRNIFSNVNRQRVLNTVSSEMDKLTQHLSGLLVFFVGCVGKYKHKPQKSLCNLLETAI